MESTSKTSNRHQFDVDFVIISDWVVCTCLYRSCATYIVKLANFQDIEMEQTAFERESFVPICTSKSSEIQRFQNFENAPRGEVGHF